MSERSHVVDDDTFRQGLGRCPLCDQGVDATEPLCGGCGLDLRHPDLPRYVAVKADLDGWQLELEQARVNVGQLETTLRLLRHRLRSAPVGPATPPPDWSPPAFPGPHRPAQADGPGIRQRREWNANRVRDLLLWTGAALIALSAISLVAVLWSRDRDGRPFWTAGRVAIVLLAAIIAAVVLSVRLRRRLPATAEAVGTLTLALAAAEWYAVRRVGFGDSIDATWWWALGAGIGAAVGVAAIVSGFRSPLLTSPLLTIVASWLVLVGLDLSPAGAAIGLAVCASVFMGVACELWHRAGMRVAAWTLLVGSMFFQLWVFIGAIVAVVEIDTDRPLGPAVAVAALAFVPAAARWRAGRRLDPRAADALVAIATLPLIEAVLTACTPGSSRTGIALVAAISAVFFVLAAELPVPLRTGASTAAGGVLAVVAAIATFLALYAALAPLGSLADPWDLSLSATANEHLVADDSDGIDSGLIVITCPIVLAVVAFLGTARGRRLAWFPSTLVPPLRLVALVWSAITVVSLLPTFTEVSVWIVAVAALCVALAIVTGGASIKRLGSAARTRLLASATIPYLTALGWAFHHRLLTVALFAFTTAVSALAARLMRAPASRSAVITLAILNLLATVCSGVLAVAASTGVSGLSVGLASIAVLLCVVLITRPSHVDASQLAAVLGIIAGLAIAGDSWWWLATTTTCVAVGLIVAWRLAPQIPYHWGALAAGAGAVMCWIAAAGAGVRPEGFVLTAMSGTLLVVAASLGRRQTKEALMTLAFLGILLGIAMSAGSEPWLAASLSAACVATAAAALIPTGWAPLSYISLGLFGGAVSAWLAAAGIELVEPYTATWAVALLAAGMLLRRDRPEISSWWAYGLGLLVLLLPTTSIAIADDDLNRTAIAVTACVVTVAAGVRARLKAPLLIGAGVMVAIGLDAVAPAASEIPRWIPLASGGVLLVWMGATTERRFEQARRLRDSLGRLG